MHVAITNAVIDSARIVEEIKTGPDGAVCVFDGIVRDNTRGRQTLFLDYEAYETMALQQMQGLAAEAVSRFGLRDVALVHRLGRLHVGETSVLVAVASAHRGAAFDACRWLIDTLKKTVPIWKKEQFVDGAVWADGEPFPDEIVPSAVAQGVNSFYLMVSALVLASGLFLQAPIERRAPQKSTEPVQTLHVETRLVNVALNVADDKGAPVGGLQRDDFELSEDGHPQKIAVFERESTTPLSIVLAIDASESVLRNERLEKDAARHFVKALLRTQDELDLMDFSDTVREIVPFTNDTSRIESGLNEIQRGDATALYNAIYLAGQRLQSTSEANGRRRVIVLITDGGDTVKGSQYTQALEQAQRAGAMVYSIIIVPVYADAGRNTGGEHALIQMAEDTGGKYYYVEDPKDLEPAFRHVSDDLRTQYLLGYYAPERGSDNSFRTIRIKMKDAALQQKFDLRYRSGYYADSR